MASSATPPALALRAACRGRFRCCAAAPGGGAIGGARTARAASRMPTFCKAREQELEACAQRAEAAPPKTKQKLRAEIEALGDDRRKLNTDLIGTAARLREVEARLSRGRGSASRRSRSRNSALRQSLTERRDVIAEILAALQRMGRRPPPALLVSPEDAAKSVRSAIVLGAVVPEMRERAEAPGLRSVGACRSCAADIAGRAHAARGRPQSTVRTSSSA